MGDCVTKQIENNEKNINTIMNDFFDKKDKLQPPFLSNTPTAQNIETPFVNPKRTWKSNSINPAHCINLENRYSVLNNVQPLTNTQPTDSQVSASISSPPRQTKERAPTPFINQHPENDRIHRIVKAPQQQSAHRVAVASQSTQMHGAPSNSAQLQGAPSILSDQPNTSPPLVPGHKLYSELFNQPNNASATSTQPDRSSTPQHNDKNKIGLLGDSNFVRIYEKEMAESLGNRTIISKYAYNGATSEHLDIYSQVMLRNKPGTVIIHAGTNDVWGRNKRHGISSYQIAIDIIKIGERCKSNGVKHVFISSILKTKDKASNDKAIEINRMLERMCPSKGMNFIDNDPLNENDLYDQVHLSWDGLRKYVDNLICILNH